MALFRNEHEESLARQELAPGLFLEAWKQAVLLAGERLFTAHRDYTTPAGFVAFRPFEYNVETQLYFK